MFHALYHSGWLYICITIVCLRKLLRERDHDLCLNFIGIWIVCRRGNKNITYKEGWKPVLFMFPWWEKEEDSDRAGIFFINWHS